MNCLKYVKVNLSLSPNPATAQMDFLRSNHGLFINGLFYQCMQKFKAIELLKNNERNPRLSFLQILIRRWYLLLFLFCFLCGMRAASWANPLDETLPNGLKVFILKNPGTSSVAVDLWVKAGSRYESPQNNGISHFVEHLLFKGTSKRTAKDISREIAAVGGILNGYTHWEYTQLHISLLPVHLGLALEILSDIGQKSLMSEEMVGKERNVILEEISLANINPPSYILNLVSRTLFPENSLGMPISGTKETVGAIRRQDLLQFYRTHYVSNNIFLTIVGNVEPPKVLELVQEKLASWPMGDQLPPVPFAPSPQDKLIEVRARKFLDQAIVVLALQAMGRGNVDRPAFEIINAILGAGGNSRLYQEIREKRGLSYLVGSLYHPLSDTGLWATYAGTDPKNIKQIQSIFFQQMKRIQQEPLSPNELEEMKNYIRGRTIIRNENNSGLAEFVGQGLLGGVRSLPEEFIAKIKEVSAEDVMRVARAYLKESQCNVIILKPYPGLRMLRGLF
jgi:predicted Zn-dependent peptidase